MMLKRHANTVAACLLIVFGCLTTVQAEDSAPTKKPEPDAAAVKNSLGIAREVYKAEFEMSKKPDEKAALAKKILVAAQAASDDPPGQFALLGAAKDMALLGNDFETALAAIDVQDQQFEIDPFPTRIDILKAATKASRTLKANEALSKAALDMITQAVAREKYDAAKQIAALGLGFARQTRDNDGVKSLTLKTKHLEELEAANAQIAPAREKLKDSPTDPDANTQVGRFFCLSRGDWTRGLPMLVLGTDAALKDLAERELKATTDAPDRSALADAWWDYAAQQQGLSAAQIQVHAAALYEQALPKLTALAKAKAEKRIQEAQANGAAAAGEAQNGWTNLLAKINPQRDAAKGKWAFGRNGLACEPGECWIDIPYQFPEEYDLHITFTRLQGNGGVAAVFVFNKKRMQGGLGWYNDNSAGGFEYFNGTPIKQSPSSKPFPLKNDQKYDVLIQVRKNGVGLIVDNKLLVAVQSDGSNVTPLDHWPEKNLLGLHAVDATIYHVVEIRPAPAGKPAKP